MRFLTAIVLGFRRASRHLRLVVLFYLASLLPALLILSLVSRHLGPALGRSLFAGQALSGNAFGVVMDFLRSPAGDLDPVWGGLPLRLGLIVVLQILVAAGAVEVLLEREHRRNYPFLQGIGAHALPFLRSAVWFLLTFALVMVGVGILAGFGVTLAEQRGNSTIELAVWLASGLLAFLLYAPLDLAYDLSRIAAAAHGERRTFAGFFRALGHTLTHPGILAPLYLSFALLLVGLQAGYVALRAHLSVANAPAIAWVLAVQQIAFLIRAFLQSSFWGAEIAYFQGIGEPRWCRAGTGAQARPSSPSSPSSLASPASQSSREEQP